MPIAEEIVVGYDAYRTKLAELEKNAPKERVVFMFEGGDAADSNWCPKSAEMVKLLDEVKKENLHGLLIRVKVTKAEWNDRDCKYKIDSKFKIATLPAAAVFNQKLTLGRMWIHKKIEGDKCAKKEKIMDLFK